MKTTLPCLLLLLLFAPVVSFARPQEDDPILDSAEEALEAGRLTEAEGILSGPIQRAEQNEPHSPKLADYLEELSQVQHKRGKFDEAIASRKSAQEIMLDVYGPTSSETELNTRELGELYREQRKTEDAEPYLKQALEIARANPKIPDLERLLVLELLADVYENEKRWTEAEQLLLETKQACTEANKHYGPCLMMPQDLALVYRNEGKIEESDQLLSQGTFAPAQEERLDVQAQRYQENGQYAAAEDARRRAISWVEENEGKLEDPQRQASLANEYRSLGQVLEKQGRVDEAEKAYITSIEFEEQGISPHGLKFPEGSSAFDLLDFDDLLDLCRAQKRLSDVEPVIQHAIELLEKLLGPQDESLVGALVTLAGLYQEEGEDEPAKYALAVPLYDRALQIRRSTPDNHPPLDDVVSSYVDLLHKMHQDAKAADVESRFAATEKVPE